MAMKTRIKVRMQRHDFQRVDVTRPGTTLFCDSGILWVTQSGDNQDYVLMPGQELTVGKRSKVFVEAMRDSNFHLS